MNLSSPYKILPINLSSDTIFLTFSPYYHIRLQEISQYSEIVPFLKEVQNHYKVVIMAQNYVEGEQIMKKISEAKQEHSKKQIQRIVMNQQEVQDVLEGFDQDKIFGFLDSMVVDKKQQKRSIFKVKSLIQQVQSKISMIRHHDEEQKNQEQTHSIPVKKMSKKIKKSHKNKKELKKLNILRSKKMILLQQLDQKQIDNRYLEQMQINKQDLIFNLNEPEEQSQDEWLLYDSREQQKQNHINR